MTREIGKPYAESLGEVQEIVDTCDFFVSEGGASTARRCRARCPTSSCSPSAPRWAWRRSSPRATSRWRCRPGTSCRRSCAATRWCGSRPTTRPRSGEALTELFLHGGVPEGVLNLVQADGPPPSRGLEQALGEGLVDKVGFTGSSEVGSRIGELCGRHLQQPCLELGGKNPLVVMPDADLELAVEGALFSGFGTAGQRCTSLGTAIVHESVHDEFLRRFRSGRGGAGRGSHARGALRADDPRALRRALPGLARAGGRPPFAVRQQRHRADRRRQPARRLRRRPRGRALLPPDDRGRDQARRRALPHRDVRPAGRAWRASATSDEAMALANGHGYGLSSAIYTNDPRSAFRFRERGARPGW